MNIKIIDFKFSNQTCFKEALEIRTKVFVNEQNVPADLEYDGKDEESIHFLLYQNSIPIATSRYRQTNEGFKLERFAVLEDYRGNNFGKVLLDYIMEKVPDKSKLYLNSQLVAVDFYKKNGFITSGEPFLEAGIQHYRMILRG